MFLRTALVAIGMVWVVGAVPQAAAQSIGIGDVESEPSLVGEAGTLTLVLRSHVGSSKQRIPRAKLAAAVGPGSKAGIRPAPAAIAELVSKLGATHWVASRLVRKGHELELQLIAYNADGEKQREASVIAAVGDYETLTRKAVTGVNRLVGAVTTSTPKPGSFARVGAAGRASSALGRGDVSEAATLLAAAPARLGFELSGVRDVGDEIANDESIDFDLRLNATLVGGNLKLAKKLASSKPKDAISAGLRARVHLVQLDYPNAGKTLAEVRRASDRFVILSRAALAGELSKSKELAEHYAALLKGDPYIPALALAVPLRPGALGEATEKKLVAAATRIASRYPELAAQIGARAVRGNIRTPEVGRLAEWLSRQHRRAR